MNSVELWERYKKYLCFRPEIGLMVDISRMRFPEDYFNRMEPMIQRAYHDMDALEAGGLANPDEKRMVGHYWLRNPDLAPKAEMAGEIRNTLLAIQDFSDKVRQGKIKSPKGNLFSRLLIIGIGGSILGPQFMSEAMRTSRKRMKVHFMDNTDPDGIDRLLDEIGDALPDTLMVVVSKSGKTIETRNGMIQMKAACQSRRIPFEKCAVAITQRGSDLDRLAEQEQWLARFPMWDWVGGRTSVTSAVGLLPAALQGIETDPFLEGARSCDEVTREKTTRTNPAALLALMWHYATGGQGARDMVILPYKDRLHLFSRYLQQLVMESLGKERDLGGHIVNQGITVYGNKGSTDQHAYVQQLRDGVNNFFVTFIEVLKDGEGESIEVEKGITSGDYLNGFLQGTRRALSENSRESMTLTIERVDGRSLGVLIALYERAVGLYASLIRINAYHQPGVEAGKKAAERIIQLQVRVLEYLKREAGKACTAEEIAFALGVPDETEAIFKLLEHAAANDRRHIVKIPVQPPFVSRYHLLHPKG